MSSKELIAEQISTLCRSSCEALFQALDCPLFALNEPSSMLDNAPKATISARSDALELTLVIQVPLEVLAQTYRAGAITQETAEPALSDWICELVNQMMGRLKNKLLPRGCRVILALPQSSWDLEIDDDLPADAIRSSHFYEAGMSDLAWFLDIRLLDPNLQLTEAAAMESVEEGGMEIF